MGIEDDYPLFAQVQNVYVIASEVILHVHILHCSHFDHHMHAFVVQYSHAYKHINVRNLHSPLTLHIRRSMHKLLIVPKYHLTGTLTHFTI